MITIDACGLSCPQPVILALNAIKDGNNYFQVIIDNNTASENIQRLAVNKGYKIEIENIENKKIRLNLKLPAIS